MERNQEPPVGGKLIFFPELQEKMYDQRDTDYATSQAESVVEACLLMGLDGTFVPIFKDHLRDLHLVIVDDRDSQISEKRCLSRIALEKVDNPDKQPEPNAPYHSEYGRVFFASLKDINQRTDILDKLFAEISVEPEAGTDLRNVALDWIFAEQAMVVLGNACYMNNRYGKYLADFNGQNDWDKAEHTVGNAYLESINAPIESNIIEDFTALKRGFGLVMLHESLLARGVLTRAKTADWVLGALRELFPQVYKNGIIGAHLKAIKAKDPAEVRARYQAFNDFAIYEDDDEDDLEDFDDGLPD